MHKQCRYTIQEKTLQLQGTSKNSLQPANTLLSLLKQVCKPVWIYPVDINDIFSSATNVLVQQMSEGFA